MKVVIVGGGVIGSAIAYYLSLTALYLFLNVCQLRFKRWS